MPLYDFRCEAGHVTELKFSMADVPAEVACPHCLEPAPDAGDGWQRQTGAMATRVFVAPAAIHFKGPGFYQTDVVSTTRRKRRSNPGDDLRREFDHGAARIADAI